jgi:TrmH family RNA methyltransferase
MLRNIVSEYIEHLERTVAKLRVVLVEPKNEGNVGAVARAMKNFGVEDLVLVNPCPLGVEARQRAMHGADILEAAKIVPDFESSIEDADLIVGTSGVDTQSEKRFNRIAVRPREFAAKIQEADGVVALLFGREDFGLLDAELRRCELLVKVPAADEYPILNLSHAATILFYELFVGKAPSKAARQISAVERERLHTALSDLLDATDYPAHKRPRTKIMVRRLLGRAVPSKWEFHALMGVFQRATKRIRRLEGKP